MVGALVQAIAEIHVWRYLHTVCWYKLFMIEVSWHGDTVEMHVCSVETRSDTYVRTYFRLEEVSPKEYY